MSKHLINVQWGIFDSVEKALEDDYHPFYYSPKNNEIYDDMGYCNEDDEFYGIYPTGTDIAVSHHEMIDLNDIDMIREWKEFIGVEIKRQNEPPVVTGIHFAEFLKWKRSSMGEFMLVVDVHSYQSNSPMDPEEWDMDVECDGVLGQHYKLVKVDEKTV